MATASWSRVLAGDDVAQIVHDLKTPLATIALEVELLLATAFPAPSISPVSLALQRISAHIADLDNIVHDILDLASIEGGQFTLHRVPTELRSLLEEVIEHCLTSSDRSRVQLDAPRGIVLVVDGARIQRVIANLLRTACAFSPRASRIVVRVETTATNASFSVSCSHAELFSEHRRGAPQCGGVGSGIGLFVSTQTVEAHGGTLGVESIYGAGTRIFFELPLCLS